MCDVVSSNADMSVIDVSYIGQISFETIVILKKLCNKGIQMRLCGSSFLAPCFDYGYDLQHLTGCFQNLTKLVVSMASTPASLNFLADLPMTVNDLTLDRLLHPISDFKFFLPELSQQLNNLGLTRMFHFTKYDLVEILQGFSRLDFLDLTETERLTRGTVATILTSCYNLQEFQFSHDMSRDEIRWLELVYLDYQHVTFPDRVYTMCAAFRDIYDW